MKKPKPSTIAALLLSISLAGCVSEPPAVPAAPEQGQLVAFLVRHGEKVDASHDPELSDAGRRRAGALARTLRSAELEYVHSSNFIRTRDTAAPTARRHGLEVELYDPRDLPGLVAGLRGTGGRHLVVGHSNTTPALAELLGGDAGPPIDEASEYDRLYIVTVGPDGVASSVMMRYGRPYAPARD